MSGFCSVVGAHDDVGITISVSREIYSVSQYIMFHSSYVPIISRYSKCTVNKDIHFTFTFSKPRFVHGESVKLAWFPAGLLYRVAEVLLVIREPGALRGRRYRLSIDIVVGYSENKEKYHSGSSRPWARRKRGNFMSHEL